MTAIQPLDAQKPVCVWEAEEPSWCINLLLGTLSRLRHGRKAKLMEAICGSGGKLSNARSTALLWNRYLSTQLRRKQLGGSWYMIYDIGVKQGIVPQKNVISAAKPRWNYLRRTEAAREKSTNVSFNYLGAHETRTHPTTLSFVITRGLKQTFLLLKQVYKIISVL